MSTPALVKFGTDGAVYLHWDGYPENIVPTWDAFCDTLEHQTSDCRYDDGAYLASKFVVFMSGQMAKDPDKPLDFLSIGICNPSTDYGQCHTYLVTEQSEGRATIKEVAA